MSESASKYRALALIDRDGTLIEEKHYLSDPNEVVLHDRSVRAIKLLEREGVARVLCTNQSGVGRGFFTAGDVEKVHAHLQQLLAAEDAKLDAVYYATANPDSDEPDQLEARRMRKPARGMAKAARQDLGLESVPLFSIGDRLSDITFAHNCGGTGILVRTGYGKECEAQLAEESVHPPIAPDLYDAARILLNSLVLAEYPDDVVLAKKLHSPGQLRGIARRERSLGRRVVLANGCFDLLHGGHVSFLENARMAGDVLILAVNSNASIRRIKGEGRPILDEPARLQMLAGIRAIDYLTVFHTDTADEILEEIHPDIHAKGTDYKSDTVPERLTSKRLGIETVIAGAPKENSTRDIIEIIVERGREGVL